MFFKKWIIRCIGCQNRNDDFGEPKSRPSRATHTHPRHACWRCGWRWLWKVLRISISTINITTIIIIVVVDKKKEVKLSTSGKGLRRRTQNWNHHDSMCLCKILERVLPVCREDWDDVSSLYNQETVRLGRVSDRLPEHLKSKYREWKRKKKPYW